MLRPFGSGQGVSTSQVFRDVADGSCAEGKDTNVVDMLASSCLRLRGD